MNAFTIAWDSIWHHRLRSLLTTLGIIIGVFAVVTLTSLGGGVQQYVNQKFQGVGATLITVMPALPTAAHARGSGHRFGGGAASFGASVPSTLTASDVAVLDRSGSSAIRNAAGVVTVPDLVRAPGHAPVAATVSGVSTPYFGMQHLAAKQGTLVGPGVVLGAGVARNLFGRRPALGRAVLIGAHRYRVTAVLRATQGAPGSDPNDTAFMPLKAALSASGQTTVSTILVAASSPEAVARATKVANRLLTARHPSHPFRLVTAQQILTTVTSTTSVITDFLAGIASIALLVGGIGIMNIMLVTVSERFREIGIRKALGARDSDILFQFLTESVLLALIGGVVGTLLSGLATHIVGHLVGIPASLTARSVLTAVIFSILVGVVFGVLPALRGARLMPADALRAE